MVVGIAGKRMWIRTFELPVGISAMFEYGFPPPRILDRHSAENQRERRIV
jgi:hypothetical protein